jgi:hypothetical protein
MIVVGDRFRRECRNSVSEPEAAVLDPDVSGDTRHQGQGRAENMGTSVGVCLSWLFDDHRCDKVLFMSSDHDVEIDSIAINMSQPESREAHYEKTKCVYVCV